MPPYRLSDIRRRVNSLPDAKKVFVLCEGTNTEPELMKKILSNSSFFGADESIRFIAVEKTGRDVGTTDLKGLIRLADSIISDADNHFNQGEDKVLVIFDLDVYARKHSIPEIKAIIEEHKRNMIFAYTNPAVELFLTLCIAPNAYDSIIQPSIKKILKNDWITSSDGTTRRFIAHLFYEKTHIDSKKGSTDFTLLASNVGEAIKQESLYLSRKLIDPEKSLISNFGYVLEKIRDNDIDSIEYLTVIG